MLLWQIGVLKGCKYIDQTNYKITSTLSLKLLLISLRPPAIDSVISRRHWELFPDSGCLVSKWTWLGCKRLTWFFFSGLDSFGAQINEISILVQQLAFGSKLLHASMIFKFFCGRTQHIKNCYLLVSIWVLWLHTYIHSFPSPTWFST